MTEKHPCTCYCATTTVILLPEITNELRKEALKCFFYISYTYGTTHGLIIDISNSYRILFDGNLFLFKVYKEQFQTFILVHPSGNSLVLTCCRSYSIKCQTWKLENIIEYHSQFLEHRMIGKAGMNAWTYLEAGDMNPCLDFNKRCSHWYLNKDMPTLSLLSYTGWSHHSSWHIATCPQ